VDLTPISNLKGWISSNGGKQKILFNKKNKIYIPFVKSKFVSGQLLIKKDKYSAQTFDISNIRITAIDTAGNQYYTLTDRDGNFILNLPPKSYKVFLNSKLFSESFIIENEEFMVDLENNETETVTFSLIERKRKINIRKN